MRKEESAVSQAGIINNLPPHSKNLRPILETIAINGNISEIDLFARFPNRKMALESVRILTSGRFHILNFRIQNGVRTYYFSEYFREKNGIPQEVPA